MSRLTDFLDKLTPRAAPIQITTDTGYSGVGLAGGHNQDLFAPVEYGDYIATSNDVYSAVMLRAKSLAKLNLQYFDRSGQLLDDGGDVQTLLSFVNPFWTFRRLLVQYEASMSIWGQNYWVLSKTPSGKPTEIWWVKPTHMKPVIHSSEYITGYQYQPPDGGRPMLLDASEVIWQRYPNIIDQFTGLAPLAAGRLAADSASSAMHANQKLFDQGLMLGGAFMPPDEGELTTQQAADLEEQLDRRFRGVDKAHRWAVFRHAFKLEQMGVTPRDADFIDGMNLSFRQVCRAFGVPSQLLNDGEFATLANLTVYERQLWEHTMEFEAAFLADELNEQLVPMFRTGQTSEVRFDLSKIAALQEDRTEKEQREMQQIADGRLTINEWRLANGYEEVEWGDVAWMSWNMIPVASDTPEAGTKEPVAAEGEASARGFFDSGRDPYQYDENRLTGIVERLLARQLDAVISTINARTVEDAAAAPFDYDRWVRQYVDEAEPQIVATITKSQRIGNEMIGNQIDVDDLAEAASRQASEFTVEMARRTNRTLYDDLAGAIQAAMEDGLDTDGVTGAVRKVLGPDVAEWRARRIAATEVTKSTSWGQMEVWRVAGVKSKRWITMADPQVRDTHQVLHRETVAIDDAFLVGGCIADAPGLSGCAEEDINCRCRLEPVGRRSSQLPSQLATLRDALGGTE